MIPTELQHWLLAGLAVLALLGLVALVRGTRSRSRAAVRVVGGGVLGMAGRTVVAAGLIVGVQWLAIILADHRSLVFWFALAVPALLAGATVVRAFTVTVLTRRGGGR